MKVKVVWKELFPYQTSRIQSKHVRESVKKVFEETPSIYLLEANDSVSSEEVASVVTRKDTIPSKGTLYKTLFIVADYPEDMPIWAREMEQRIISNIRVTKDLDSHSRKQENASQSALLELLQHLISMNNAEFQIASHFQRKTEFFFLWKKKSLASLKNPFLVFRLILRIGRKLQKVRQE